ncbi:MAG TPA: DNA (cytosine-5-)-methyltransferase [Stenomitos sp.]
MKYLSLFSGIGGFELGIQQAHENNHSGTQKGMGTSRNNLQSIIHKPNVVSWNERDISKPTCVGFSEIDKYATQIYQKHFPEHKNYGDITKIKAEELPDFDFLCGGFPCQSFSIAGKRGGFRDTRGTLFFDIARILKAKHPRLVLLENVKGLLSHDEGRTFTTIIATLDELGYDLEWQVLNSKNFGVPQNRERVFIVGHLRGTRRPEVFPITESNSKITRRIQGDVSGKGYASQQDRVYFPDSLMGCLPATRTENKVNILVEEMKIRRLTPKECERLQGFPDDWTLGVSDTQRYKCLGNAVTVNVIEAIIKKLSPPLSSASD